MNKLLLTIMGCSLSLLAHAALPVTVQGCPYKAKVKTNEKAVNPQPMSTEVVDFDQIKYWAGTGSNRCAVIIQWNDDREESAKVFGYKWDGEACGEDALRAICSHPQLYGAFQTGTTYGSVLQGFGWDVNNDGVFTITEKISDTESNVYTPDSDGLFLDQIISSDDVTATDANDYWYSGWYEGFWSYWVSDNGGSLTFSGTGMTGRVLTDGCIDAWQFAKGMSNSDWKSLEYAEGPAARPEVGDWFEHNVLHYKITDNSVENPQVCVTYHHDQNKSNYAYYVGDLVVPEKIEYQGIEFTVTGIEEKALYKSTQLTSISLPNTITTIGECAFQACGKLTEITIPSGVTALPEKCFSLCRKLKTVNGMDNIQTLGADVFNTCTVLETIHIPAAVTEIPDNCFNECNALASVTGMENVTKVGFSAFFNTSLMTDYSALSKVTSIGGFAFCGNVNVETFPLMEGLTSIGNAAFGECTSLKYLIIPQAYNDAILPELFSNSGNRDVVVYMATTTPCELGLYSFRVASDKVAKVYIPYGLKETYYATDFLWEDCDLNYLTPKAIFVQENVDIENNECNFSAVVENNGIVEENIPQYFIDKNDFTSYNNAVAQMAKLEYRSTEEGAVIEEVLATAEESAVSATLSGVAPGNYEYRWVSNDGALTSEWTSFVIEVQSGIDSIAEDAQSVEYYTIDGLRVENPTNGIYLQRQGNKTIKKVIRK